jgi:hypothetical protein
MPDTITPRTRTHADSHAAYGDVRDVDAQDHGAGPVREIHDSTALAIASWWQSPGAIGHVLASLASGMTVDVAELLDDIAATREEARRTGTLSQLDATALDCLATWAINHPTRIDDVSSVSRQHFIDTGRYLTRGEVAELGD